MRALPEVQGIMIEMGYWPGKGYVLCGDVEYACGWLKDMHCTPTLVVADPPYGVEAKKWGAADVKAWGSVLWQLGNLCPQATVYWWGGIGKPSSRPFFEFILAAEAATDWRMRDLITWSKKRAYGKSGDYLFTREECAVFTWQGAAYQTFNIPLLDVKRGYAGFSEKYPAKSEYKRRTNVWSETEILRGKLHDNQKAPIVARVPIEVHTSKNGLVLDLYSGSGETSVQALALGRPFIAVEKDRKTAGRIAVRIGKLLEET